MIKLLKKIVMTVSLALLPSMNLNAKELPGYPYDVLSQKDQYECVLASQVKVTRKSGRLGHLLYKLCLAKSFDSGAQNILRQSFGLLITRLINTSIFECARNSVKQKSEINLNEGRDAFLEKYLINSLGAREVDDQAFLEAEVFISGLEGAKLDPDVFAEGYLNLFYNPSYIAEGKAWRQHISVAINKGRLGSSNLVFGSDPFFWAAQLAIAFFKNLGVAENPLELPGSFSHELAKCVMWEGKVEAPYQTFYSEGERK